MTSISFQIILTRCGVVQPSLTRQLVSGKGGVGDSAADSPKYILILEVRYGGGVFDKKNIAPGKYGTAQVPMRK